jgi:hypothetical protein
MISRQPWRTQNSEPEAGADGLTPSYHSPLCVAVSGRVESGSGSDEVRQGSGTSRSIDLDSRAMPDYV